MGSLRPSAADVLLAARSMIEHHGHGAAMAARRADDELARGDRVSSATWSRIMAAIETLQIEEKKRSERTGTFVPGKCDTHTSESIVGKRNDHPLGLEEDDGPDSARRQ